MATRIKHKRSSVAGKQPIVSQLESGELAINTADGKVYLLRDDNTVQDITKRVFEGNSEVRVDDLGDSAGAAVTVSVNENPKATFTDNGINLKDNVDIEDAGILTLRELTASGDDGVSLKAPNTLDAGYTLTLPSSQGTIGQILAVDATGQLYFNDADIFGGNVVYVSAEQGDDENDGQSAPVRTIKRACQIASGLVYNADGSINFRRVNIKVAVGDYTEQNPVIVPDNTVVKGDGLRGCIIRPANANQDMLRVRNACYFGEFTFRDGVDVNQVPLITADYAVAFDDPFDSQTSRVGYTNLPTTRPTITTSPYIQNASIISFLGMSGAKIDGSKVNSPNVPIYAIEAENPAVGAVPEQGKSMVANAFTMLSFGGTGWRLLNDAYAQIVSCFEIFLLNGVYCQSGGYCSITNSATNFGLYALRSSGYSPKAFSFDRAYVTATGQSEGKQTLTIVGINRDTPVEEFVLRFREPDYKTANILLNLNKDLIAQNVVTWIDAQIAAASPSIWAGFTYDEDKCKRDVQLLVDAVKWDIMFNSNYRSIASAIRYYSAVSAAVIDDQLDQTIAAFGQAKTYTVNALDNSTLKTRAGALWDEIIDIVTNGTGSADAYSYPNPTDYNTSYLTGYGDARAQLIANKTFIQDEIDYWIAAQVAGEIEPFSSSFSYDAAACRRDTGLLIDALVYDLTYGGNLQTYDAALAYFVGAIAQYGAGKKEETLASYERIKEVIEQVIAETDVTVSSGNTTVQDKTGTPGSAESITFAGDRLQEIIDYITADGTGITRIEPATDWVSATFVADATGNLGPTPALNIAQNVTQWINEQIQANIWYNFEYDSAKCNRDTQLIVEAAARDTFDTGNRYSRSAGLAYYSQNLQDSSRISISGQELQTIAAINRAKTTALTYISDTSTEVQDFVGSRFDIVSTIINDPNDLPDPTEVSSAGDITNDYKTTPTETNFNGATDVNTELSVITIVDHGFSNLQKLIYDPNGNALIGGLDAEQTYYVSIINEDEFTLTFDESGEFPVNIYGTSTGTHKFLSNIIEFFVEEILSSHQTYQTLILESGAESYEFVPGRAIAGSTGGINNSAIVYTWEPRERRLVVSIEEVVVGSSTLRVQFDETSTITSDHASSPNTSIGVNEAASYTGSGTATFSITATDGSSSLTNLVNLPEQQIWFHRPSIVNSSSHTWEYAGSGTDYNALPQNGGNTRAQFEQFEELPGRCYSSGTNELGDFKVGDFITAFNRTGNITFRNKVQVDELDALRLSLSDVAIEEISANVNLGDDEIGGSSDSRLSTQLAIRSFIANRLGGFVDKSVSTAAVPGAIVQLNTNGQLNPDLIPATRQFTNTNTQGYLSRLAQVDDIPATDLKAGDIATENYEQIELTLSGNITAEDGATITQPGSFGAIGYAKGNFSNSGNILVASIEGEWIKGDDSTGSEFTTGVGNNLYVNGVDSGVYPSSLGVVSEIIDNFFLRSSNTSQYLVLDPGADYTLTTATITDIERNSNVATVTTSGAHNLNVGNNVQILCTDDVTYNENTLVISTPTSTTFTYANSDDADPTKASASVTGTIRTIVTSADGNAQGAVTETRYGVLSNVDNANITGGSAYTPIAGTLVYENVALTSTTGVGSGTTADITVTAGQVTDVDIKTGGTGYAVGDLLSVSAGNVGGTGSGFEVEVTAVEKRAYVDILGGELFVASASSIDFVEDNSAVQNAIEIGQDNETFHNFLAGTTGAGGAVDYSTYRITITAHGFANGDPVTYDTLGNVAIGGLINENVYYTKFIDVDTIELYEDFSLLNQVEFVSTPANNNHRITCYTVNLTSNTLLVPAHGLTTGDAIRIESLEDGSTANVLFDVSGTEVPSGSRFFVGSVTTNSFTLHDLRSDALSSINGLVTNAKDIDATGVGTAQIIANNVQVNAVINTSSRIKVNWNSLAATNIDAENIISGTISPSRLGATGVANSDSALFGDSSYKTVVQSIKKSTTTDNPITLSGSSLSGEFYGDPVSIGIANADYDALGTFSTLGTSRFLQTQFDVNTDGSGEVFIKDGVVDAGTLDSLDSAYFLNPSNLTSPVPVTRGGTNITTYARGDLLYAATTGTLNPLNIGRNNAFLKSNGTEPEWGTALDLSEGLDVGSAKLTSSSIGSGSLYNTNVSSLEIGGDAENIKIGNSSDTRSLLSFVDGYEATVSQNVVVNLNSLTQNTNAVTANGETEVPMADTTDILAGMIVTGSGSIPSNTTVSGVTDEYIYLSAATTGTVLTGTTLTFTYTPLTLGVKAGDTINIASSGVTNLDGNWPVTGATDNATSFTVQTDANVTANPIDAVSGTISIDNSIVIRNKNIILGSTGASGTATDAVIRGENGVGTNNAGGEITVQGGLGTGNATGGDVVISTGEVSTSSDIQHTATERLRIDTSGKATFTGEVEIDATLSTSETTVALLDDTATTINMGGAATTVEIGAATGTTTIHNNVDIDLDLNVDGGDITTNATTFNLINTNATTLNIGGAATTVNIGTGGDGGGTTTVGHDLVVTGDLTVNGNTTTINSTTLTVDDLNIVVASGAANPAAANGAGITVDGASATWNYASTGDKWVSNKDIDLASGKDYNINGANVLNSTTLGSGVVNSSLQQVGTIGTGVWQGTIISPTYGGTGINNGSKTITLGGNFTHTGAHTLGLTTTGNTSITLPTSGTLATTGNPLSQFASTTSAQLRGVISDETGSGALVFGTNPTITTGLVAASTTMNLFDTTATTINFGGAATTMDIGAATGTTTVKNNLSVEGNLNIGGLSDLSVSGGTFALANTGATTVNAFGAATTVTMGATTGNFNIRNTNVNLTGNLFVNGNTLDTDETGVFNLLKDNATTLAFAQAATEIVVGDTKAAANLAGDLGEMVVRLDLRTNNDMYIDGDLIVSQINNTPIGNVTPSSGAFTTLASNNLVTFTDATNATGSTFAGGSAAVKMTGGLYVNKDIRADNFIGDMSAAFLTSGTIPNARIAITGVTQHQASITGTGALNSGSITSGFGNINIGSSIFSGNGSGLTTLNASNLSSGTVADARIAASSITQHQGSITGTGTLNSGAISSGFGAINIGTSNLTATGSVSLGATNFNSSDVTGVEDLYIESAVYHTDDTNTYMQFHAADQWRVVTGGTERLEVNNSAVTVAGNLTIGGTATGNGSGLSSLNAGNLSSGTVSNARITGTYSNLTGTGALGAGSITSGFGNINIGTSTFTGNGSGLSSVNAATLDSLDSTQFVRSDANDTATGQITFQRDGEVFKIVAPTTSNSPYIGWYQGSTRRAYMQFVNGGTLRLASDQHGSRVDIGNGTNGLTYTDGTTWTVWHSGNDGSGSGLDADTLDGVNSASFLRSDTNDSFSGTLSGAGSINITGNVTAANFTGNGSGLTGVTATNANTLDGIDSKYFHRSLGTQSFTSSSTTADFITELTSKGFFNYATASCKVSWSYAGNNDISDTGFGTFELAGCTIETFTDNVTDGVTGNYTVRVTRPTTGSGGAQVLVYNNQGPSYAPGWRQMVHTIGAVTDITGQLRATGEITAFYSDERLKDKVGNIENALDKVLNIETFLYKNNEIAKENGFKDENVYVGVSAQSVERVLPEVVKHAPFDITTVDGKETSKSGEWYKTVQYEKLVPLLIESTKEQQAQIKAQAAEIDELRAMVQKLLDK